MGDSQGKNWYYMILGHDIFSEPKIHLCLSYDKIRLNVGTYKICTAPVKDVLENNFNKSSNCLNDKSFQKE